MFRHLGRVRRWKQNLQLASSLSFVAGVVNVVGFFATGQLTTNVTGHFAFFSEELLKGNWIKAFIFMSFVGVFFLGSFVSGFLVERNLRKKYTHIHRTPILIQIGLFLSLISYHQGVSNTHPIGEAYILLFSMGLQNSLVTQVSRSLVRTTHLTGLFTDLGIELAHLFFHRTPQQKEQLHASIKLRLSIILFFFLGCTLGGYLYLYLGMKALLLDVCILGMILLLDGIRFRWITLRRKQGNKAA